MKDRYKEYCTGCGLCGSVLQVSFIKDAKGYEVPDLSEGSRSFCEKVCPAAGKASAQMSSGNIWGRKKSVYLGWAKDPVIREKASSGGIITAVCCYLLESGLVDAVIHTKASGKIPYETETVVSVTVEDVLACMGSRYSVSAPLKNILQTVDANKRYAFVGKPCDVSALHLYMNDNPKLKSNILYLLSFFCAGQPSEDAQKRLLEHLKMNTEMCRKIQYRGNGWPGYTMAEDNSGRTEKMTYAESWGHILGRDVRHSCRFCLDGIGEFADISCGDAWYITPDNRPDFSEALGRNVIFARTEKGDALLKQIHNSGGVYLEQYDENQHSIIQRYQLERRAGMKAMLSAMKLCGRSVPSYDIQTLKSFEKLLPRKNRIRRFWGTIKRIVLGKI